MVSPTEVALFIEVAINGISGKSRIGARRCEESVRVIWRRPSMPATKSWPSETMSTDLAGTSEVSWKYKTHWDTFTAKTPAFWGPVERGLGDRAALQHRGTDVIASRFSPCDMEHMRRYRREGPTWTPWRPNGRSKAADLGEES